MSKNKIPATPAIRILKQNKIEFQPYIYEYQEKGGTAQTARELGVNEHNVIKTLVLDADGELLFMLMHGDKEVSMKELARQLQKKTVKPADSKKAMNATGYMFGGTSPFGSKKSLPVYAEKTIFELDEIYINGGKRGFIVKINPNVIENLFDLTKVAVAI
jgi:Cys-tRNA(Pro) deacylase